MWSHWITRYSFEDYYHACHPTQCSYTRVAKNDAIDIITTLFSLMGGGLEQHTRSSSPVGCQAHSIASSATSRRSHTVPTFGSTVDYTSLVSLLLIFRSSDTDRCCNAYICCLVLLDDGRRVTFSVAVTDCSTQSIQFFYVEEGQASDTLHVSMAERLCHQGEKR